MNDVETRVRATLQAVAETTGREHIPPYVEASVPKRRRPLALLAVAAALVLVVGVAVMQRPVGDDDVRPAASTTTAAPTPAAPTGGRLLAEGTAGSERWALYGVDRLPGTDESPCFALLVTNRDHTPRGCGFGGSPGGTSSYQQLGPAVEAGDQVLLLGILDFEVDHVVVELQTSKHQQTIRPVTDPAHPDGARYFVMAVPRSEGNVQLRLNTPTGTALHVSDIRVDGPVGG